MIEYRKIKGKTAIDVAKQWLGLKVDAYKVAKDWRSLRYKNESN